MANTDDDEVVVSNEMANRMSLFYAYPTPLLKTLSDATTKFVTEVNQIEAYLTSLKSFVEKKNYACQASNPSFQYCT